jgi:acetyltransferase
MLTNVSFLFPLGRGSMTTMTKRDRYVQIRHMALDDTPLLVDLFHQMSPETRRLRFLSPLPDLPDDFVLREATHLATINPLTQAALIATVEEAGQEHAIGVARLAAANADMLAAEFAIVIRDDYQGEGLGTKLLDLIIQVAMVRGLKELYGLTLAENEGIQRLMRKVGLPVHTHVSHGEMTLTIELST